MRFLAPPPLRQGDRVAVVAPAGPFDRESFDKGLAVLASRYTPVFDDTLFESHRYLAGADASRGSQLQRALDDHSIRGIFAARGGYGSMRLLPLNFTTPKIIAGFSDITALHLAAQKHGWQSLHAPVLTQLGKQPPEVVERFFATLEGRAVAPLVGTRTVTKGFARGPLIGGNLSVLTRLIGTPFLPSLNGAVLLIEDVGERPYRLDRMWQHLKLSGQLHGIAGIVFGEFTGSEEKDVSYTSGEVLDELAAELGVPCAAGFDIGHGVVNQPVMLGADVQLDATAKKLEFV